MITAEMIEDFLENVVWQRIENNLIDKQVMLRAKSPNSKDMEELRYIGGQIDAITLMRDLPELLLDEANSNGGRLTEEELDNA